MRPERLLAILIVCGVVAVIVVVVLIAGEPAPPAQGLPAGDGRPAGTLEDAVVVRIADGDTVTIEIDGRRERLRYVGVDAPEVANPEAGIDAECGADAARDANGALVDGERIYLEPDTTDRDRFGRLLRHPWLERDGNWFLVTEQLVSDGAIEARSFTPDTLHDRRLDDAERSARAAGAGIWGDC
ncbi:MAG TPA: thermonuclease family protein [Candidatus Limnocylindria bacterium]